MRKSAALPVLTVILAAVAADRREVTDMEDRTEERWLTRRELAERYGVPVKTPAEWASKGTGPRYASSGGTFDTV